MSSLLVQASAHAIPLRDESVQCVVTSPPYWGLRAYAGEQSFVWGGESDHAHEWQAREGGEGYTDGGRKRWQHGQTRADNPESWQQSTDQGAVCPCGAWYGSLGLEPTPELYVEHMVAIFREVWRVLRPDGTVFLNLGDSYFGGGRGGGGSFASERRGWDALPYGSGDRAPSSVLKPKDLVGIPWRVAFALQADGWWLRSDIVWSKPNPMPESVTDRPTKSHEYVFLLTKSERYFYDIDAIREPTDADARNARTVWTITTQPYPGAHFATFPEKLVEPCVKAGSAQQACGECGAPWARVVEREPNPAGISGGEHREVGRDGGLVEGRPRDYAAEQRIGVSRLVGWQPTCKHDDGTGRSVVLDPFCGTSTVGRVALRLGRSYVGLDLSREYLAEHSAGRLRGVVMAIQEPLI